MLSTKEGAVETQKQELVRPCPGTCGRMTRPPHIREADVGPGAVIRYKQGYCGPCYSEYLARRPLTKDERQWKTSLEGWLRERNARIHRRNQIGVYQATVEGSLEQFHKAPIFSDLVIEWEYSDETKRRTSVAASETFREGAVKYIKDTSGEWRYSVIALNGETIAQSEGYTSLANAKRGARALVKRLAVEEPDE